MHERRRKHGRFEAWGIDGIIPIAGTDRQLRCRNLMTISEFLDCMSEYQIEVGP